MKLTFYGVRGSVPVSGEDFVKYGGNTPCVHIELDCGHHIIIDAGTGISLLNSTLQNAEQPPQQFSLLLSHQHWDHIQGFPFFNLIYKKSTHIDIYAPRVAIDDSFPILDQMDGAAFPLVAKDLAAQVTSQVIGEKQTFTLGSATIETLATNHPGGGLAYKISSGGKTVAYVTDNELTPEGITPANTESTSTAEWAEFLTDCDLLIHDAQFTLDQIDSKRGWGHSCIDDTIALGLRANVKQLALFHHYSEHNDATMDAIEAQSQAFVAQAQSDMTVFCAQQGQRLTF